MKANEAPEKLYFDVNNNLIGLYDSAILGVFSAKNTETSIEYARTDAFIAKACEYISEHIEYYMKKDKMCNVPLCPLFATKSFIEDFRKYMER